jgi:hypothetical protein
MATKQNREFYLPDWTRRVRTLGIETGAEYFTVRELAVEWLVDGATVAIIEGSRVSTVTIATVEGYTVNLTTPSPETFSPAAVLRPLLTGWLTSVPTVNNTSTVTTVTVNFDIRPGSVRDSIDTFTPFLVAGAEVFGFAWNWAESVTTDYQWDIEKVDFQRGVVTTYQPVNFGTVTQRATILRQHDKIDMVLRFFERAKGRRGQFWFPSGNADMDFLNDAVAGATTLTVAGDDLFNDFSGNEPVYKGVAIYTRGSRRVFRKINSVTLSGGNSILNLNAPLTFDLPLASIAKVSWMRPVRFASDDQAIEYLTNTVAQMQVTTTTVAYAQDEQDYEELDGGGYWVMDHWGEDSQATLESLDYLVNVATVYGDVASRGLDTLDDLTNSETWAALG